MKTTADTDQCQFSSSLLGAPNISRAKQTQLPTKILLLIHSANVAIVHCTKWLQYTQKKNSIQFWSITLISLTSN